ncbi:MAG: rhomboid family intramembrane serine protease, partial [Myxococcales bacterium]|nr:rhomboid family intramembrane serine protease [Myxococcales bacterium]
MSDDSTTVSSEYQQREDIVASLLGDSSSRLVAHNAQQAKVLLETGEEIALLTCDEELALPELKAQLASLVEQKKSGTLLIAAVAGGDDRRKREVRRLLRKSAPSIQFSRQFGFYLVGGEGQLQRITGRQAPALERAVRSTGEQNRLDEEGIQTRLAQGHDQYQTDQRRSDALAQRKPWVTWSIAATCVLLFALEQLWSSGAFSALLWRMGANSASELRDGEVWRLFSSAFLHGGAGHLLANLVALAVFGPILERVLGAKRYVLLYGLAALGGSLASAFVGNVPLSVGSSGAIWGLMTAGLVMSLVPRGLLPSSSLALKRHQVALPLIVNVVYSFQPGIDLYAHFGGGIAGFIL